MEPRRPNDQLSLASIVPFEGASWSTRAPSGSWGLRVSDTSQGALIGLRAGRSKRKRLLAHLFGPLRNLDVGEEHVPTLAVIGPRV